MNLSKIEIITGMSKLPNLKRVLTKAGVLGMTVIQVLGCGIEKGTREYEIDEYEEMELLPERRSRTSGIKQPDKKTPTR